MEAGGSGGDPVVSARLLCTVQAGFSLLGVCVLAGGKLWIRELSAGEVCSRDRDFGGVAELPGTSSLLLSPEIKVTASSGSHWCCGLSPGVGNLYKLQTPSTMELISFPPPISSSSSLSRSPEF